MNQLMSSHRNVATIFTNLEYKRPAFRDQVIAPGLLAADVLMLIYTKCRSPMIDHSGPPEELLDVRITSPLVL